MADKNTPNPKMRYGFRVLASLYILFLAFGLIKDFSKVPDNQRMIIGAVIALFIVLPCWFLYGTYCDWRKARVNEGDPEGEPDGQQTEEAKDGGGDPDETEPALEEPPVDDKAES